MLTSAASRRPTPARPSTPSSRAAAGRARPGAAGHGQHARRPRRQDHLPGLPARIRASTSTGPGSARSRRKVYGPDDAEPSQRLGPQPRARRPRAPVLVRQGRLRRRLDPAAAGRSTTASPTAPSAASRRASSGRSSRRFEEMPTQVRRARLGPRPVPRRARPAPDLRLLHPVRRASSTADGQWLAPPEPQCARPSPSAAARRQPVGRARARRPPAEPPRQPAAREPAPSSPSRQPVGRAERPPDAALRLRGPVGRPALRRPRRRPAADRRAAREARARPRRRDRTRLGIGDPDQLDTAGATTLEPGDAAGAHARRPAGRPRARGGPSPRSTASALPARSSASGSTTPTTRGRAAAPRPTGRCCSRSSPTPSSATASAIVRPPGHPRPRPRGGAGRRDRPRAPAGSTRGGRAWTTSRATSSSTTSAPATGRATSQALREGEKGDGQWLRAKGSDTFLPIGPGLRHARRARPGGGPRAAIVAHPRAAARTPARRS